MASLTTQRPPHRLGLASPASVGTSSHCCHTAILSLLTARDAHSRESPGSCRLEALGRAVGQETVLFIIATRGSLSRATQHSPGVTALPSSPGRVPDCHHAASLQSCQCPPAPHCAQPCFGDSSPTTVSPCSEATTASIGAFSHSPAPTAHTGWATPLRPRMGAGLAMGACSRGGDPLRKGAPPVLGSGQRALPCPPSCWWLQAGGCSLC